MKSSMEIRAYCIENNLFENGTNSQYTKMFEMDNAHDKAVAIWLCSDTSKTIEEIEKDIQ